MELGNLEQNNVQNDILKTDNVSDSIDNFEPSHVNVEAPANSNLKLDNINMEQVSKKAGDNKGKSGKSIAGLLALILAFVAILLTIYLYTEFVKQNKKIDKLNAEINKTTKTLENTRKDLDKKIEEFKKEADRKVSEQEKDRTKADQNKLNYIKVAENVLNEVGREYKKDQKTFQDDKGVLDQKAFENKFLKNNEIVKMNSDGKWKIETEGSTIKYIYEYNLEKDKVNNFKVELTLKSEGNFEVKSFKMPKENAEKQSGNMSFNR